MTEGPMRPTDNAFTGDRLGGAQEPTFSGALSFMRRRYSRDLKGADLVVWGVPFDAATSNRPGARFGPQAIRRASAILDGDPQYPFGFDLYDKLNVIDWGDCGIDHGRIDLMPGVIEAQAAQIIGAGSTLLTLGGDHSVTYSLLQAHAAKHGPLALVQFDAHQDTWHPAADDPKRIDHGAFVARAVKEGLVDAERSIQIGIRTHAPDECGIEIVFGHEVETGGVQKVVERVLRRVGKGRAYLTFDIDCLDPAFAPGTGTPVSGGLTSREAMAILRALGPVDFVGFDVMEVSPPYDHADITAVAAATMSMTMVGLVAEKRRK
ncbi:MAG TPA: agmatinase [Xanthobacteraceae bacterium]|nr:agmatinase [Xanthobacteraceae bacterium]